MFLLVFGRHVGAHPNGHQHGVSIQISLNLGDILLRIARELKTAETWFLARLFILQSSIISHILEFIYWTVAIFSFDHMTDENREFNKLANERAWSAAVIVKIGFLFSQQYQQNQRPSGVFAQNQFIPQTSLHLTRLSTIPPVNEIPSNQSPSSEIFFHFASNAAQGFFPYQEHTETLARAKSLQRKKKGNMANYLTSIQRELRR